MKNAYYSQISPARDITAANFINGQINIYIKQSEGGRWNPYRSFFKHRYKLTTPADAQLDTRWKIAPSWLMGNQFWQQIKVLCNGRQVESIDDYIAQIGSLRQRYAKAESRRIQFYKDMNHGDADFHVRQNQVCSDGLQDGYQWHDFRELSDQAGDKYVAADDWSVVGAGYEITITTVNNVEAEHTQLAVGDVLRINSGGIYKVATITDLEDDVITTDYLWGGAVGNVLLSLQELLWSHGKKSNLGGHNEICYNPPLSFFSIDKWLPGNWHIELTPHPEYAKYCIESKTAVNLAMPTDFKLDVSDLQYVARLSKANGVFNSSMTLSLNCIRCQIQNITQNTYQNKVFVINKSANKFTIAFQEGIAGQDTRYSRAFFKIKNDTQNTLQRLQLRYNSVTLPSPLPDIDINKTGIHRSLNAQQYYETLAYNGTMYLDEPESYNDWIDRGTFYSYTFKRAGSSNRLFISTQFRGEITAAQNVSLLVFDHFNIGVRISGSGGKITCDADIAN